MEQGQCVEGAFCAQDETCHFGTAKLSGENCVLKELTVMDSMIVVVIHLMSVDLDTPAWAVSVYKMQTSPKLE